MSPVRPSRGQMPVGRAQVLRCCEGRVPSRHVPWGLGALSRRLLAVLTLAILGPQLFGEALQPTFGGLDLRLRFAPCLLGARLEFFIHEALRLDQCLLGLGAGPPGDGPVPDQGAAPIGAAASSQPSV